MFYQTKYKNKHYNQQQHKLNQWTLRQVLVRVLAFIATALLVTSLIMVTAGTELDADKDFEKLSNNCEIIGFVKTTTCNGKKTKCRTRTKSNFLYQGTSLNCEGWNGDHTSGYAHGDMVNCWRPRGGGPVPRSGRYSLITSEYNCPNVLCIKLVDPAKHVKEVEKKMYQIFFILLAAGFLVALFTVTIHMRKCPENFSRRSSDGQRPTKRKGSDSEQARRLPTDFPNPSERWKREKNNGYEKGSSALATASLGRRKSLIVPVAPFITAGTLPKRALTQAAPKAWPADTTNASNNDTTSTTPDAAQASLVNAASCETSPTSPLKQANAAPEMEPMLPPSAAQKEE